MATTNITSTSRMPVPSLQPHALFEHFSDRATQITGRMPDSGMAPNIQEGDLLQIEPCDEISTGGHVYAFAVGDQQFVRALMACPNGQAQVVPYNHMFESFQIDRCDIMLIGRVVGVLQYRTKF